MFSLIVCCDESTVGIYQYNYVQDGTEAYNNVSMFLKDLYSKGTIKSYALRLDGEDNTLCIKTEGERMDRLEDIIEAVKGALRRQPTKD